MVFFYVLLLVYQIKTTASTTVICQGFAENEHFFINETWFSITSQILNQSFELPIPSGFSTQFCRMIQNYSNYLNITYSQSFVSTAYTLPTPLQQFIAFNTVIQGSFITSIMYYYNQLYYLVQGYAGINTTTTGANPFLPITTFDVNFWQNFLFFYYPCYLKVINLRPYYGECSYTLINPYFFQTPLGKPYSQILPFQNCSCNFNCNDFESCTFSIKDVLFNVNTLAPIMSFQLNENYDIIPFNGWNQFDLTIKNTNKCLASALQNKINSMLNDMVGLIGDQTQELAQEQIIETFGGSSLLSSIKNVKGAAGAAAMFVASTTTILDCVDFNNDVCGNYNTNTMDCFQ